MLPIIEYLLYRTISDSKLPIIRGSESIGPVCPNLEAAGLLIPVEPQTEYFCLTCHRACHRRVYCQRAKGGVTKYFYRCPKNKHTSEPRTYIDPFLLRCWQVNYPAFIEGFAKGMGLQGNVYEHLPGVSWKLGDRNGREFYFIMDTPMNRLRDMMRESSSRPEAVLFVRCEHMIEIIRSVLDNTLLLTEDYVTITPDAQIVVDTKGINRVIGGDAPPSKPRYEFRRKGKMWSVRFEDEEQMFSDRLGFRYIAALLAKPNEPIDAYELRRFVSGLDLPPLEHFPKNDLVVDADYLKKVHERYKRLQADLAQADDDPLVCEEIHQEMNELSECLKKYGGKPGRRKTNADEREKARQSVLKAILRGMDMLQKNMPKISKYFHVTMEVGKTCCYHPHQKIDWSL